MPCAPPPSLHSTRRRLGKRQRPPTAANPPSRSTLRALGDGSSSSKGSATSIGDAPIEAITATEICDNITGPKVGDVLGLEVTAARADDSATPQCLYDITGSDGAQVGLTIAGMRPESEVGGETDDAAFDYVVDLNRSYAGTTDVEETEVQAGDRATHLRGAALHFGVVASGGHLLTVAFPVQDTDDATFEDLLALVGSSLG